MGLYRRLARSKRGMSTVFGALFFVILILMGFNLMLWVFIQQDAYNNVVANMNQTDQQTASENIVPQEPGTQNFTASPAGFNIAVNNEGGTAVVITRIYVTGTSGTTKCALSSAPCVIEPAPSSTLYSFSNGVLSAGVTRQLIAVSGLDISDCSSGAHYRIILASTRGRLFSLACPWESPAVVINQASIFTLNIGPLSIFFDFNSFNFTMTSQTQSNPAWVLPDKSLTGNPGFILWVKVVNQANSPVTIAVQSGLLLQSYTGTQAGTSSLFIVNSNSVCPTPGSCQGVTAYTPITLPAATTSGPSPPYILKFYASSQGGTVGQGITQNGTYLAFIGLFYTINGNFQGETVPFVATNICSTYPTPC
jgi:hypothetical protein